MIPIDKRLSSKESLEYALKVKSCMDKCNWDELIQSLIVLNKDIELNNQALYKNLEKNNKNWKIKNGQDYIAISWLTLDYNILQKIKDYVDNKYIKPIIQDCSVLETYKCAKIKSYCDLVRRRKHKYSNNVNKKNIKNILNKKYTYESIYMMFEKCKYAYEQFSNKGINSWIIDKTEMNVCPYCNLAYTYNRGKKVTAQLDHFFSKSEYPMFALCYYNLIPSCPACNHIKTDNNENMTSPYEDNAFNNMKIKWKLAIDKNMKEENVKALTSDIEIFIDSDVTEDQKNISIMKLNEAYNKHKDYASEVIKKIQTYLNEDSKYLIQTIAFNNKISSDEIEHFYLGTYVDKNKKIDRILEKMIRDFVEQYKNEV